MPHDTAVFLCPSIPVSNCELYGETSRSAEFPICLGSLTPCNPLFVFSETTSGLPAILHIGGSAMTTSIPTGALAPMSYTSTFNNPCFSMSVCKKDCSTKYNRFLDFAVGIMFPVKSDNTIAMSPIQFVKVMDIIVMELQSMLHHDVDNSIRYPKVIFPGKNPEISHISSSENRPSAEKSTPSDPQKKRFTPLDKRTATAILTYLLSRPNDWTVHVEQLAKIKGRLSIAFRAASITTLSVGPSAINAIRRSDIGYSAKITH